MQIVSLDNLHGLSKYFFSGENKKKIFKQKIFKEYQSLFSRKNKKTYFQVSSADCLSSMITQHDKH